MSVPLDKEEKEIGFNRLGRKHGALAYLSLSEIIRCGHSEVPGIMLSRWHTLQEVIPSKSKIIRMSPQAVNNILKIC